jgi:hypothetical protein
MEEAQRPDGETIVSPTSAETEVTFTQAGEYMFEIEASDTEFTTIDSVNVKVAAPPRVEISIGDVAVSESGGEAIVPVTLSTSSPLPVSVEYLTFEGTATAECDYATRFGTLAIEPGAMGGEIRVPIVNELAEEPEESFNVRLGNASGADVVDDSATVSIADDDSGAGQNSAPAPIAGRTPGNRSFGVGPDPVLSWSAYDPDSDPLAFDVYFGSSFTATGQVWTRLCPSNAPPGRSGAASAYDESNDRLIVFGGKLEDGTDSAETWVLSNATGRGGAPMWSLLDSGSGPSARFRAAAGFDPGGNRLIVHGGCSGECASSLRDTWVMTLTTPPEWTALPDAPAARSGAASAFDETTGRLILFGGMEAGVPLGDLWVLKDSNGLGAPEWEVLSFSGGPPAPRSDASAHLDPATNRMVLFGGRLAGDEVSSETWILENANGLSGAPRWSELAPSGEAPAGRWGAASLYDPGANRLVVFGGSGSGYDSSENAVGSDLWMLSEANASGATPAWVKLSPENGPPAPRLLAANAYSASEGRLIVAFGENNRRATPSRLDDLWVLDDAVGTLPLVASGQSAGSFQATTPALSTPHFWRIVARDPEGARRGGAIWSFQPNAPPTADAGSDQTIEFSEDAELRGTGADDGLPGPPLSFAWELESGPGGAEFADAGSAVTTASFDAIGDYELKLTASDGELRGEDGIAVTVLPPNEAPRVDAGPDQTLTLPVATTVLAGAASDDALPR